MKNLDQLERQAESQERPQQAQDQSRLHKSMHDALATLSRHFAELARSPGMVDSDVTRNFAVQGTAPLQTLRQVDYFVRERKKTIDSREYLEQVTLRFHAVGQQVLMLETYADHATDRLRNYLNAYGLRLETQPFRNERGVTLRTLVSVLPDVPAAITATANWASGTIRLKLRNVEVIGDAEYCYDPAEVDRKLLDELSKVILGQSNELPGIGRHQNSLRMRIVARPVDREFEPEAQPDAAASNTGSRSGLFGGLKLLWTK